MKRMAIFVLVMCFAGSAWALEVDFDRGSSSSPSGWVAIEQDADLWGGTRPQGQGWSKTFADPQNASGQTTVDGYNRSGGGKIEVNYNDYGASGDLQNMLEDALGNKDTSDPKIGIIFSQLDANRTYTLLTYFNRVNSDWGSTPDVDIYVGETNVGTASQTTEAANADAAGKYTITFTADGSGVSPEVQYRCSGGDVAVWVNGLVLTPEPATMAFLGLGSLIALRRRRR